VSVKVAVAADAKRACDRRAESLEPDRAAEVGGTPARTGPIAPLNLPVVANWDAFVTQVNRLMGDQSVAAPELARLMELMDRLAEKEQTARGLMSDRARQIDAMSRAEVDAELAEYEAGGWHPHADDDLPPSCPLDGEPPVEPDPEGPPAT
jgi:hypothetical protein